MKQRHAFTLTEMLVLFPMMGLVGALLLAALDGDKQTLQAAACLNNMRQWGMGFMLYANDWNDYYPFDGDVGSGPCGADNAQAWFNVLPPYLGQKTLCQLYTAGKPPTPLTKGIWTCPSATNVTVQPTLSGPYFMYSMSSCWHLEGNTQRGIRRNRMTSPTNTILFCEEPEDNFPETNGRYDTVTRHHGGSNFVFGDGHADWIAFTNFCRSGNPGCTSPLDNIEWDNSGPGGDWNPRVPYHWWPFVYASTSSG